ncbi:unnamed protein product [Clonostachys byssicola]|uniref:Guanylate kinase-like domain-containing protein n=1 Tax=Clonostachys byssicola TaxID=160290 RepID=A0A9N9UMT8_9HYPO|nr:unnamed protein product [Clonostachys byssicola]
MPALDISNPGVSAIADFGALLNDLIDEATALKVTAQGNSQSSGIDPPVTKADLDNISTRVDSSLSHVTPSPSEQGDDSTKEQLKDRRWQVVETAARDLFGRLVTSTSINSPDITQIWNLFDILTIISDNGQCDPGLLFWLIEELIESKTIAECRVIFDYLESRRERITPERTFKKWSLIVLRMCTELLRRLSRAEDTAFCGRVFIFLFQSFPLGDRSSVNLRGEYHVENVTTYESTIDNEDSKMEVDTPQTGTPKENTKRGGQVKEVVLSSDALYPLFWPLQEMFSQPLKLFDQSCMQNFKRGIEETVKKFSDYPSDEGQPAPNTSDEAKTSLKRKRKDEEKEVLLEAFNPKYLTSKDLFELEISDLTFRRHIMVQALITLNFILSWTAEAKKKYDKLNVQNKSVLYATEFNDDDAKWAKEMKTKISEHMRRDTPGRIFYRMVDTVLARDKNWVYWKMASCPTITRNPVNPQTYADAQSSAQRSATSKRLRPNPMGAVSLDFLQPLDGEESLEKFKEPERHRLPDLDSFKTGIADDDFAISMASNDLNKATAVAGKASKSWRALRVAGKFKLASFDKIDDPQNINPVFLALSDEDGDNDNGEVEDLPDNRSPIIVSSSEQGNLPDIIDKLLGSHKGVFGKVVRHTTREPNEGEVNGKDYYFVKTPEFNQLRDGDRLIEFTETSDVSYGTSIKVLDAISDNDKIPIVQLDVEAAQFAKDMGYQARYIFISPSQKQPTDTDMDTTADRPTDNAEESAKTKTPEFFNTTINFEDVDQAAGSLWEFISKAREQEEPYDST